jgi:hypothetical protein
MLVNLAVAAALAVAGATLLTALETLRYLASPGRRTPRRAASPPTPALVNVLLTSASPGAAAYQATLLDLAARGLLTARTGPAGLWLAPASTAPASTVPTRTVPPTELPTLMDHERLAMQTTLRRLASAGGAPFGAAARPDHADRPGP